MATLEELREKILAIDLDMLVLLGKRMEYIQEMSTIKKMENLPFEDSAYFQSVLKIKQDYGQKLGLSSEEIKLFFELLQTLAINKMKKDVFL